jgi:CTP-dependent riboflavin kinase
MDIEKYNNEQKELERISSRLRRSGGISERTITKLIDWDVITRDVSSNSELILKRIEEYSELIKAEIAEMSGA